MTAKFNFLTMILCALMMVSCTGPQKALQKTQANNQQNEMYGQSAAYYLSLADDSTPPERYEYQLMAAELYLRSQQAKLAANLLRTVSEKPLPQPLKMRYKILQSAIYLAQDKPKRTIATLKPLLQVTRLSSTTKIKLHELLADAHRALQQHLQSAQQRILMDNLLTDHIALAYNRKTIWDDLNALSLTTLDQLSASELEPFLKGWVQLAAINQHQQQNPEYTVNAVSNWHLRFPNHPAQMFLGNALPAIPENLADIQTEPPEQIALLLPLQGTHKVPGLAIRDGFLASYYHDLSGQSGGPSIKIYDTAAGKPIQQVYQNAVDEGADFVVGPLSKGAVLELSQLSSSQIKTPILALNQHPKITYPPQAFYQFSLSPEGEARHIADHAFKEGLRNALVVVPDNNWGKRTQAAFSHRWHLLGGKVLKVAYIDAQQDHSNHIRKLLNIDSSMKRSKRIKRILKERITIQPRRRQDVDFVFLAAPPIQARQIRPLFDFYYAAQLPIYATSSIYSGHPDPKKDRDMNGVMFCDMPWMLGAELKNKFNYNNAERGTQYDRLFAMGIDAYQLTSQLKRILSFPQLGYPGVTGTLYFNQRNEVERALVWAKLENGLPKKIGNYH